MIMVYSDLEEPLGQAETKIYHESGQLYVKYNGIKKVDKIMIQMQK